jgi:hypothetical protein
VTSLGVTALIVEGIVVVLAVVVLLDEFALTRPAALAVTRPASLAVTRRVDQ